MSRRGNVVQFGVLMLTCSMILGCGGGSGQLDLVDASGTVQLDGQPHGPAQLNLQPTGGGEKDVRPPIGAVVNADGSFSITTYEPGDGAPPGDYIVTLAGAASDAETTDPNEMMQMMGGGGGPSTQPLTITIPDEGSTSLELKFVSTGEKAKPKAKPGALLGDPQ